MAILFPCSLFLHFAFFYTIHFFSWPYFWTNCKRLLWPYSYMFALLFALNYFFEKNACFDVGLIETFVTGNIYFLKKYIGFQYIWFLPVMFSMLITKSVYQCVSVLWRKTILIAAACFFVVFWVFLYDQPYAERHNIRLAQVSLLSFMMGMGMFYIGYCTKKFIERNGCSIIIPLAFLLVSLLIMLSSEREGWGLWSNWFTRALAPTMFFVFLYKIRVKPCVVAGFMGGHILLTIKKIGQLSLPIFLFHQPVNYLVCTLMENLQISAVVKFILSFCIVILLSYAMVKFVISIRKLNVLLFPR